MIRAALHAHMPRTLAACLSHDADTQRACASARAAHTHAHGPASTARAPAADHTHTLSMLRSASSFGLARRSARGRPSTSTDDAYGRASDATMPISDEEVCAHLDGTSAEDSREHLSELLIGSSFVATGPLLSLIDDSCCCCCCADGSSPTEVPSSPAELLIDLRTPRDQSGCT